MMWLLIPALVILTCSSLCLSVLVGRLQRAVLMERSKSHAMCIAAVFAATGQATAARALRDAAARFESVEEIPNLTRIRREQYKPDGPSVPALWLRAEADRIDPEPQEEYDLPDPGWAPSTGDYR